MSKQLYFPYRGFADSQYERMRQDGRSAHGHAIPPGESYDRKAATHCLRLLAQGNAALRHPAGQIPVDLDDLPDQQHAAFIRKVRAGKAGLQTVLGAINQGRLALDAARAESPLPEHPDEAAVNAWLVALRHRHWVF